MYKQDRHQIFNCLQVILTALEKGEVLYLKQARNYVYQIEAILNRQPTEDRVLPSKVKGW
jgi:hypothetical protein